MAVLRSTCEPLTRRRCVCCGYDGKELQAAAELRLYECPACEADLYARPPMSYAQMEGIVEATIRDARFVRRTQRAHGHPVRNPASRTARLAESFLMAVIALTVLIVMIAGAAAVI